jgi:hypothetical protein
MRRSRSTISMAVRADSSPLFSPSGSDRSRAWSRFSVVRTPNDRQPGLERRLRDALGARSGHVLEVRGVAPDHRTERDDGVVATRLGEGLGRDRDLERARHPRDGHVTLGHPVRREPAEGAVEQPVGDEVVEAAAHERDPHALSVDAPGEGVGRFEVGRHRWSLGSVPRSAACWMDGAG